MRTTTSYTSDFTNLTNNTSAANSTLGLKLVNDALRYLVGIFFFNERSYIVPGGTVDGQAAYRLPYNVKQVINVTVEIGSTLWQPVEIPTRKRYDALNVIPFDNDFPQFFYIYNGEMLLWPTPASDGNEITINYKKRIVDLSAADYTTGTVSMTNGSTTITGSGTAWTTNMADRWINIPLTALNATTGDGEWYQIASVESATSLTLYNEYQGGTAAGATYTIGEVPILPEDYQDLPLYRALYIYHTTINKDTDKAALNKSLYDEGYARLEAEFGSKTSGVGITPQDYPTVNPNLFQNNVTTA